MNSRHARGFMVLLTLAAFLKAASAGALDGADLRDLAPAAPAAPRSRWVAPRESATPLGVGADWALRQFRFATDDADERALDQLGLKIMRFVASESAPQDGFSPSVSSAPEPAFLSSMKMSRLGQVEFEFRGRQRLRCDFTNGSELSLSQPLFGASDLQLRHGNDVNSLQLRLPW